LKVNNPLKRNIWVSYLALFTSFSTLICCALPALLVSLGLGATLVGLVSNVPGLIWISENKNLVFIASFLMLSSSMIYQYQARSLPCPIDPEEARACSTARKVSMYISVFSLVIWMIGASFAYIFG
jgi:mercuric ion transport protein